MIIHAIGLLPAAGMVPGTPPVSSPEGLHECATATSRCDGTLQVPLDWGDPASGRITVAFAFLPAARADGTVFANLGGPAESLPDVPLVQQALGPVLERKNLLLMDPRGLGKSSPLTCPGAALAKPETIAPCARSVGPRGAYFTADQASHDLDAVRKALGLGTMSYYGNSYGTVYAQAYAARYPAVLNAIFLDSTMIVGRDGFVGWSNFAIRVRQLDIVCARSKACARLPGTASGTWTRLVNRLRQHPDPHVSVFQTFAVGRAAEPVFGREATAAAHAYLHGDPAPLRRLARLIPATRPPVEEPDFGGYLAYRCGDGTFPFDRQATAADRRTQAERYYDRVRPLAPYKITDVFAGIGGVEPCIDWPTPRHSPPRPPATALTAVPVLAMTGELDINSPGEVAHSLRAFPNATVVGVPFGPHALARFPSPMGDCVRDMLRTFLTTKQVTDRECTAENYRALGVFPETVADLAPHPARKLTSTQRRVLAAAFATAADAAARRNPGSFVYPSVKNEPGLRGGRVAFGDVIALDDVRYVRDLPVNGTVTLSPDGRATATLTAEASGHTHDIRMTWTAFSTTPTLTGTFDDIPIN
ncbi:alpha/beta fold hydrolase [Nonomuraea sp. NPDC050394]|uniref:alpha/beta fold hydrolase n=1 Tax=Nonomuraea sp. NPDC050394 TaxID=3364363 RepID=UPI0037A7FF87